ncbi:hypothetical protein DPMN_021587 [Dreissena polymorpha]|uniref:C2H2-type domain-containing protein n=1 Tax=Dreissena polymorpha TaxID=45954 RepID=A0A9D4NNZ9_DREPO|nr:hypothetical protein DPMN_021587 [Dreissena polymorpha]
MYHCPFCDLQIPSRSRLVEHLVKHTKEKPFRCSFCAAGFTRRDALNSHLPKHHAVIERLHTSRCSPPTHAMPVPPLR